MREAALPNYGLVCNNVDLVIVCFKTHISFHDFKSLVPMRRRFEIVLRLSASDMRLGIDIPTEFPGLQTTDRVE